MMVSNQQRISLLQVKVESLESKLKQMEKMIDKYYSVLACEYYIDGKSYQLSATIVKLLEDVDALKNNGK